MDADFRLPACSTWRGVVSWRLQAKTRTGPSCRGGAEGAVTCGFRDDGRGVRDGEAGGFEVRANLSARAPAMPPEPQSSVDADPGIEDCLSTSVSLSSRTASSNPSHPVGSAMSTTTVVSGAAEIRANASRMAADPP